MHYLALVVAALLIGAVSPLRAQDVLPVPPLSGRVIDQTGTLTPAQVNALTEKLAAVEKERGSQLVVLMVPSTKPEDIAPYAHRVADAWKIGRREVGDGLLIVVAKDDRRVRIEVARALEGAVPDLAASQIIEDRIKPAFRAGDYAGGLNAAVDRLAARIGTEGLPEPAKGGGQGREGMNWLMVVIFILVTVPALGGLLTVVLGRKLASVTGAAVVGGASWWLTNSLFATIGAGLLALLMVSAMGLGGHGVRRSGGPVIWGEGGGGRRGGGRSGGGGFSSGGGGSFGGGGASGGW